jgi:hypothetical protein
LQLFSFFSELFERPESISELLQSFELDHIVVYMISEETFDTPHFVGFGTLFAGADHERVIVCETMSTLLSIVVIHKQYNWRGNIIRF